MQSRIGLNGLLGLVLATSIAACHQDKAPPVVSSQDIEAAKQDAQREVDDARAEAAKDIKSAAKVTGGADPRVVSEAKVMGKYDVAMAKADGDHKVATEKCLTLQADMQQACKTQADADYQTATAAAKALKLAKEQ